MSRPIEEGCRCVIVNSVAGNNGTEIRIIKKLDMARYQGISGNIQEWLMDRSVINKDGISDDICGEHQLKRIDDDREETCSWSECEWKPSEVTA